MDSHCMEAEEKYIREEGVKVLPTPTKSQSDKKHYRVIQLKNGLIATLISDPKVDNEENKNITGSKKDIEDEDEEDDDVDDNDDDDDDDDDEDEDEDEDDDSDGAMSIDDDGSCDMNKKNVKKSEKLAACRLAINVGSLSDPWDIPGLAHFLEHMVFMGSEKYPEENDFSQFTENRGGSSNAETHDSKTVFYFDVQEEHFLPAMDRFAQFFISPLMKRDSINREREAVDSEFKMSRQSDCSRKDQIFLNLAGKKNPVSKFTWGNLKTLKDDVDEDKLYSDLHEFRKRHYSAHRMTVAVQARLSLDKLEKAVVDCFSKIPSNNLPPEDFSEFKETAFKTTDFRKMYRMKGIKDKCNLELTWIMPPMEDMYKKKPWKYYAQVLDSDKEGSLNYYLRQKLWIHSRNYTAWSSYQDDTACGFNPIYSLFRISLDLTDEGRKNLVIIIDAIFSYLNMFRKVDPPKRILEEIKLIKELDFRFADEDEPYDNVELADNMMYYPPEDYITGDRLFFDYNVELIKDYLNYLTPDKVNIIITDKKLKEEDLNETEPWFESKYSSDTIPDEWIHRWKNIEPLPEFHLPKPNIFIPTDFSLIPLPVQLNDLPEKIHDDEKIEIWHRISKKFRIPKCYLSLEMISPLSQGSVERWSMHDLFVTTLKLLSIEENMDAEDAGLGFVYNNSKFGIIIETYGFNEKLPVLLKTLLKYVADCHKLVSQNLFDLVKEKQLKTYYQRFIKPDHLNTDFQCSILTTEYYLPTEKHTALQEVNYEQFINYTKQFTKNMYIKCLAEGNITKDSLIKNIFESIEPLQFSKIIPEMYPRRRVWQIPEGITYGQVKNLNDSDDNSTITNYYQCSYYSLELKMKIELLMDIMGEPVFNQLRTIDQLGYSVGCSTNSTLNLLGFRIKVCAQANKFTAEQVDEKIDSFIKDFTNHLKNMSKDQFNQHKEALVKSLQLSDLTLADEFYNHWPEIISDMYVFDRKQQSISILNSLTLEEFHKFIDNYVVDENLTRRINLRVLGNADINSDSKPGLTKHSLIIMPVEKPNSKSSDKIYCINDVQEYKKNLEVFWVEPPETAEVLKKLSSAS